MHLCNAYTLSLASKDSSLASQLNRGSLNVADGKPLVWIARHLGFKHMERRVYGPELMARTLEAGQSRGTRHFLYGSTPEVIEALSAEVSRRWPEAEIVGAESPPFGELSDADLDAAARRFEAADAQIVWVGLGTPKQDIVTARLAERSDLTFVAIGAAFDFIAGTKKQAPRFMREHGLEWLFRLASEPRRLWKRYLVGNTVFLRQNRPRRPRVVTSPAMSSDRRQIAWGLVDQGLSSATNFGWLRPRRQDADGRTNSVPLRSASRSISCPSELSRSWSSEPLVVRFAAASSQDQQLAIRQGATASLAVGFGAAMTMIVAAATLWTTIGPVLLALALMLPALMLQDFCRYALILQRRSRDAALNDLCWLVVLVLIFAFARSLQLTAATALICWAAGAVVAAVVGLGQLRCRPSSKVVDWFRDHRDLSWKYCGEFVLLSGTALLLTVGLGAVSGLSDAAGFRGAQVALGPLGVLFMGATMQMTPIMARRAKVGLRGLPFIGRRISAVLGSIAAVWGLVLVFLPDRLGEALLGSSWVATSPLLPFWAAYYFASGLTFGATIGLRACGAATVSLRLRASVAPIGLILGLVGAAAGGPRGASIGLLLGVIIVLPLWWRAFLEVCRGGETREPKSSLTYTVGREAPAP